MTETAAIFFCVGEPWVGHKEEEGGERKNDIIRASALYSAAVHIFPVRTWFKPYVLLCCNFLLADKECPNISS